MLPPDVNASSCRPVDERRIRYGLGGIKGAGRAATNDRRPVRSIHRFVRFCRRVDKRVVNRRAVEAPSVRAFDAVESRRASLSPRSAPR
jgi:DNA polymerase-3 subunit alpha